VTVDEQKDRDRRAGLVARFQEHQAHLRAVAYRMLGSRSEAEDAVQEAWLRLDRADTREVENLRGWLTTVVARVCLDLLRARKARREADAPSSSYLPDLIVSREDDAPGPEAEALLADSVGVAMLVVLETLAPAERLAFVLHDMFAMEFEEIAPLVGRTPTAARQLASRARRRVQGGAAAPEVVDVRRQRQVVDAFLAAARGGDFAALVAVLDPEVVLRTDRGAVAPALVREIHGAKTVAEQAIMFSRLAQRVTPVRVNGHAGIVSWRPDGQPLSIMGFTVRAGKIVAIDTITEPARLAELVHGLDG
jgi:RNA polymerase sigma factor (sigma-70 family)